MIAASLIACAGSQLREDDRPPVGTYVMVRDGDRLVVQYLVGVHLVAEVAHTTAPRRGVVVGPSGELVPVPSCHGADDSEVVVSVQSPYGRRSRCVRRSVDEFLRALPSSGWPADPGRYVCVEGECIWFATYPDQDESAIEYPVDSSLDPFGG